MLAVATQGAQAGDEPSHLRPLVWGADAEGGAPYIFADPEHPKRQIGFEVDLVHALEKELGRKIVFRQYPFVSLVQGLNVGDFDFAMNGLEITKDRKKKVLFTKPYYTFRLQLTVRADESRFDSLTGIKKFNGVVGTLDNTSAWRYLKQRGIRIREYDDQQNPYADLVQEQIDGVLMDLPIALYGAKQNRFRANPPNVKFVGHIFGTGRYAIAVKKDNVKLKDELDAALMRLEEKGKLREIYRKWKLWQDDMLSVNQFREFSRQEDNASETAVRLDQIMILLLEGAWMTVQITMLGFLLAMVIGLPVSLIRMYAPPPFSWLAVGYVEFFRGIPVLLLLIFLYYAVPQIGTMYGLGNTLKMNPFIAAVIGFGLNYAAYEAEIYRAGISSVAKGQWEAAYSLGMPSTVTFRRIILPQAFRVILPPMTNDLVALFKDTSVVSVIAVVELTKQYMILTRASAGHLLEIALATAGLYLTLSVPLGLLSRHLEKKWSTG